MINFNENIYNVDYINKHKLSDRKIKEAGIELLGYTENGIISPEDMMKYLCNILGGMIIMVVIMVD